MRIGVGKTTVGYSLYVGGGEGRTTLRKRADDQKVGGRRRAKDRW